MKKTLALTILAAAFLLFAQSGAAQSTDKLYWYGPHGEVLAESDLQGDITAEYVYFNGKLVARVDQPSGTVHYYFSDHLRFYERRHQQHGSG